MDSTVLVVALQVLLRFLVFWKFCLSAGADIQSLFGVHLIFVFSAGNAVG